MSILNDAEIKEICIKRPFEALCLHGAKYSDKSRFYLYGDKKDKSIKRADGFEKNEVDFKERVKHTRSTADLYSRLSRPIDKIYSAKGGSFYSNLPESQEKRANALLSNITSGLTPRKYLKNKWLNYTLSDPYGIVLMEIMDQKSAAIAKMKGNPRTYPTYKPITDIWQYEPNGSSLEWVMFFMSNQQVESYGLDTKHKYYRLIDDEKDCIVKVEGTDNVTVLKGENLYYPNYFGFVPAMRNSDIQDPLIENGVLSPFHETFELADEFLTTGSLKSFYKFRMALPKYAEYADVCPTCKGEKYVEGDKLCPTCNGSGKDLMIYPGRAKAISWPEDSKDALVKPSEVAAFISPTRDFHDISVEDLAYLENAAFITQWGTQSKIKTQGMSAVGGDAKTATEIVDEMQPQADRLHVFSEMAEAREKFLIDCTIKIEIQRTYLGCSLAYGRRYMIEQPDAIWEKYSKSRQTGAPQNVLDELLNEYFEAKFISDRMGLAIAQKLMYVEPFVHLSIQQLQTLKPSEEDYKAKLYYSEWMANVNEAQLFSLTIQQLKELLYSYSGTKQLPQPEPKALPAA